MFQMIKVSAPDSVVFTMAKEKMTEGVDVYLISGIKSIKGSVYGSGAMSIRNGKMYMTDATKITAKEFKVPEGFKAQKIKFETDGKVYYYDIAQKAWTAN